MSFFFSHTFLFTPFYFSLSLENVRLLVDNIKEKKRLGNSIIFSNPLLSSTAGFRAIKKPTEWGEISS